MLVPILVLAVVACSRDDGGAGAPERAPRPGASDAAGSGAQGDRPDSPRDGDEQSDGETTDGDATGRDTTGGDDPEDGTDALAEVETRTSDRIPPAFPTDVPLPATHTVNVATESTTTEGRTYVVQLEAPGEPGAVFDELVARFDAGGWRQLQRSDATHDGAPVSAAIYTKGTTVVSVGAVTGDRTGTTVLSYSVLPGELPADG